MYEALLNTLSEESQFLKANRKIGSSQEVLLVDDLIEMADFLRDRNQDLGLEILDVEIDIKNVDEEIAELKKKKTEASKRWCRCRRGCRARIYKRKRID